MGSPIFLIGFMCSGKSRVGRELAGQLGLRHVDIDRVVEERVGPLVPYFQQHGEAAFREREREVLLEILGQGDVVVSTGGGTPLEGDNLARMRSAGRVVFLDVPMEPLMARIMRSGGDRPLLLGLQGDALRERVERLLGERMLVYAQADVTVRGDGTPGEVAQRIRAALEA
jgi:shikimate kinase